MYFLCVNIEGPGTSYSMQMSRLAEAFADFLYEIMI